MSNKPGIWGATVPDMDDPEQIGGAFGEVFDLIDEAVARITDDEIEERLQELLAGDDGTDTNLPAMTGRHDQSIAKVLDWHRQTIERAGWSIAGSWVTADFPIDAPTYPYYYTVGLTSHGLPELAISDIKPKIAQEILNDLAGRIYHQSTDISHGQILDDVLSDGYKVIIVDGTPNRHTIWPGIAHALYGEDVVRIRQVVWPDRNGRYPWDDQCEFPPSAQPLTGRA